MLCSLKTVKKLYSILGKHQSSRFWILRPVALALFVFSITIAPATFGQVAAHRLIYPGQQTPKPIVVMSRNKALQTSVLNSNEVATIKTLQSTIASNIISEISPDGKTVVIRVDDPTSQESSFYLLNTQGREQRQIYSKHMQGFYPSYFYWQSGSTALALASKQEEHKDKQYALVLVNRRTGDAKVKLLHLPGTAVSLAPDGSRVLVQLMVPSKTTKQNQLSSDDDDDNLKEEQAREFVIVGISDGLEQYRFALPPSSYPSDQNHSIAWAKDSSKLALIRSWNQDDDDTDNTGEVLSSPLTQDAMGNLPPADNPFLQKNALLTINLKTKQQFILQAGDGNGAVFSNLVWSPDGKLLSVRMLDPVKLEGRSYPIYTFSAQGSFRFYNDQLQEVSRLEAPELANADPDDDSGIDQVQGQFISPNVVLFTALSSMNTQLYTYSTETRKLNHLETPDGTEGTVVGAVATNQVLFSYSSYTTPPEIYRMTLDGSGSLVSLTSFNKEVAQLSQIRASAVSFTLTNREAFNGMLLQPSQAIIPAYNIPLVVWQEGGPMSDINNAWLTEVERPFALLPQFGISVLIMPLYGRYGFGADRFNALYTGQNFGQIDIDAMAEIVEQAISRGYTEPKKVGITGCSYGGYFTLQSLIRHPQLYAAANAQCSLIDSVNQWKLGGRGGTSFDYGSATPYTNVAKFQQDSPIYNAKQVKTPRLIFHGTKDFLPVTLMENFYWTIASNGVDARMVKFSGAKHGMVDTNGVTIPEYELYAAQEMVKWFRTHLQLSS